MTDTATPKAPLPTPSEPENNEREPQRLSPTEAVTTTQDPTVVFKLSAFSSAKNKNRSHGEAAFGETGLELVFGPKLGEEDRWDLPYRSIVLVERKRKILGRDVVRVHTMSKIFKWRVIDGAATFVDLLDDKVARHRRIRATATPTAVGTGRRCGYEELTAAEERRITGEHLELNTTHAPRCPGIACPAHG